MLLSLGRYETGSDLYCFLFFGGYGHSAAEEGYGRDLWKSRVAERRGRKANLAYG